MAISDAVGLERISRIVGYKLTKGDFSESSPNLPQSIAVLTEMNTANQSTALTPTRITSAQQAGTLYGFGSPAHIQARILFPVNGGGAIGGIPVWFYPQVEAVAAAAKKHTITTTGTATAGGTHYVVIGGRYSLDGGSYAVNIASGDTATVVASKIADVINNVLGSPITAAEASPLSGVITTTSKWKGLTANGINIRVDTGNNTLGLSYAVVSTQSGTGTPTITTALGLFGNTWHTQVINSYGFQSTTIAALEAFNGIPDPTNATGRYAGIIFKPFIALTGTVEDSDTDTSDVLVTDADTANVTIAPCPAPLSEGLAMEAAANMCTLFARITQDTPQLDVEGLSYPDMPIPYTGTPKTASYEVRDAIVKMGMSTVDIVAGAYQVQDFITTYHPIGEIPPQFRYCRNLMLDFNVRYGYYLLEQVNVVNHMIAADDDVVSASRVVKPKQWRAIVSQYAIDLTRRGLVADTKFMQASIVTGISTINPDRLETFFRYKRTGVARISSTTAEAGFNFGTV
jgi:phage tail sheath gpL-like